MYYVLACGDTFHGRDFPERDRIRDRLRENVASAGLTFIEHYWVWDRTDRAQLLVHSTSSAKDAEGFRDFLERHGISARITEELPTS